MLLSEFYILWSLFFWLLVFTEVFFFFFFFVFFCYIFFFFFKKKTAYEILAWLEFRRVLFRSYQNKNFFFSFFFFHVTFHFYDYFVFAQSVRILLLLITTILFFKMCLRKVKGKVYIYVSQSRDDTNYIFQCYM